MIVTSAKKTFFAGGDLDAAVEGAARTTRPQVLANVTEVKAQLRRLETLGKPVVAAMNGTALGGGLEIGLACHHRIGLDAPGVVYGLPEVTLGLLPGGGGVTRITRMLGIMNGFLNVLSQGQRHKPAKALEVGIVDELAVDAGGDARQGPRVDRGAQPRTRSSPGTSRSTGSPAARRRRPRSPRCCPRSRRTCARPLKGAPMPAPRNILAAAVEGTQVDFDTALRIEGRYFVELVCGQVSKNMTKAFFYDLQRDQRRRLAAGRVREVRAAQGRRARRRDDGRGHRVRRARCRAGRSCSRTSRLEAAEKGKVYSEGLVAKAVKRGRTTLEKGEALLERITPTADYNDLAGCDVVIEAVFESVALKQEVFREAMKVIEPDALLCSNTSTLPITRAGERRRPARRTSSGCTSSPRSTRCRSSRSSAASAPRTPTLAKAFDVALGLQQDPDRRQRQPRLLHLAA